MAALPEQQNDIEIIQDSLDGKPVIVAPKVPECTLAHLQQLIKNLQKAIRANQASEQVLIAAQISKYASCEAAKIELPKQTRLLIQLLQEGSADVQQSALEIFNKIGTYPETKVNFRKDNGFPVLVKLFNHDLCTLALNALGYLITHEVENAKALVAAGGIAPLVAFLSHESSRLKFFAAACTWVLAVYQSTFPEVLLRAGAIPKLLDLLNCEHEDIAWQAAGALRNLVLINTEIHQAVLDAEGLPKFKALIRANSDASERVLGLAIQSLLLMSTSSFVKTAMLEEDMFPVILDRVAQEGVDEHRGKLLRVILNLCTKNQANQDEFREQGGIAILIDLIHNEQTPESVRMEASTALWASTISNRQSIMILCEEDVFAVLHQSLVMETEKVLVGIVATISNIGASSPEQQNMLREKNIIPLILDFLRGNHPPLLESAAGAIMSIIRNNPENTEQLMEWDGPLLLARNISSHNGGVKQNVAGALRLLLDTQFSKTLRAILSVDGIKPLLLMMKDTSRPQLQINAGCCILAICEKNVECRIQISEMHAEYGIGICLGSSAVKLKSVACDLTTILCRHDEQFRVLLGEEDAVKKISSMIHNDTDANLLEKAVRASWAICLHNITHQNIFRVAGGLTAILDMFADDETPLNTKSVIMKAIASVCGKNVKNQDSVRLYNGAVGTIVMHMSQEPNEEVPDLAENAALAVWCLTLGNSRMQTAFRTANVIQPLTNMLQSQAQNPAGLINAMGAIQALATRCNPNKLAFKEAGVVNLLRTYESHDNTNIIQLSKDLIALLA